MSQQFHAVLLAGGSGTRLWPLSTRRLPKQFLKIGEAGSLLQQTATRFGPLAPAERLYVVCGENHADAAENQLSQLPPTNIIVEPMARNTLPAIALAALHLRARDPDAVMGVFPADHFIPPADLAKFLSDVKVAIAIAREDKALVTFGIPPTVPSTGFGYLERGTAHEKGGRAYFEVRAFHEKPKAEVAEAYLKQGGYDWNSGMFVWEVSTFFEELHRAQPKIAAAFEALAIHGSEPAFSKRVAEVFETLPDLSVDYGLMEKAEKVRMVPVSFGWDDVGSLSSFEKILPSDAAANHTEGPAYVFEGRGNLVMAQSRPVVLLGMKNCIVVETADAVLVLPKERDQEVKKV
ncbi:MAG TPA: mannose-1-phosphate guanylyltransferase, partial [bacterium]|nr:mannose-1-phosphate guanylyltransferase [bacterium]